MRNFFKRRYLVVLLLIIGLVVWGYLTPKGDMTSGGKSVPVPPWSAMWWGQYVYSWAAGVLLLVLTYWFAKLSFRRQTEPEVIVRFVTLSHEYYCFVSNVGNGVARNIVVTVTDKNPEAKKKLLFECGIIPPIPILVPHQSISTLMGIANTDDYGADTAYTVKWDYSDSNGKPYHDEYDMMSGYMSQFSEAPNAVSKSIDSLSDKLQSGGGVFAT